MLYYLECRLEKLAQDYQNYEDKKMYAFDLERVQD